MAIFNLKGNQTMKTTFRLIGAVATVAALFSSCKKEAFNEDVKPGTVEMTIIAGADDETRTVLGSDGAVTWSASGEQLAVMEVAVSGTETTTAKETSKDGVIKDEGATIMSFGVSMPTKKADSFVYYALYPNSAYVDTPSDFTKVKVNLASTQHPTESSFGPSADVLVAKPVTYQNEQPKELNLQFARVIAVGKMTIMNLNTTEHVKKVTFTATGKDVTGSSYIDFTTANGVKYGYLSYGVDNVVLDYSNETIRANGMTAYFTCWPFELAAGETFSVVVETETYTFTKNITLADGKSLAFKVGRASEFNVSFRGIEGVKKTQPTVYTLVDDVSKIKDGAEYLFVTGTSAIGPYDTSNFRYNGATVTVADNKTISITTEDVNVITLEAGTSGDNFYLIDSDNHYIQYNSKSDNKVYRGEKTANDDYDLWTVTAAKTTNVGNTKRRLQKNTSNAYFACYAGTQADVTIYVNEATLIPSLEKPTNLMANAEGSTVTVLWEAVANAQSYDVTCAGQTKNVTDTEATFSEVAVGTYEVSVVAKASGYKNSAAAVTPTPVIVGTPDLEKPVIKTFVLSAKGFDAELESEVSYATSYEWELYAGPVENGELVGYGTNDSKDFSIAINEDFAITEFTEGCTYYLVVTAKAKGYAPSTSDAIPSVVVTVTNTIDFESTTNTYTFWTFTNMTSRQTGAITAKGGTYYGTTGGKETASITSKKVIAKPKSITFYVSKESKNTTSSSWIIQVSSDNSKWTNVQTQSATSMSKGSWVEVTQDLSSYSNVYVRVYYKGSSAVRNIDNLSLTYYN